MSFSYSILPPSPPCPFLHIPHDVEEGLEDEGDVTHPEIFDRYFEVLATATESIKTLREKLSPETLFRYQKLIPWITAPSSSLRTYSLFYSRIPLRNDRPSQITFCDNVPFWVKNPRERPFSSYLFDLHLTASTPHSNHLLIKTGHESDPTIPPLTAALKTALKTHFALEKILNQEDEAKKGQEVAFMRRWFFTTALAAKGCPLLEPLWASSEGAWEIKPATLPLADFDSDTAAEMVSQLLQFELDTQLPLLEGPWSEIKEKFVTLDSKLFFDGHPLDFCEKITREALLKEIEREQPRLFKKIRLPQKSEQTPDSVEALSFEVKNYVERRRKDWLFNQVRA